LAKPKKPYALSLDGNIGRAKARTYPAVMPGCAYPKIWRLTGLDRPCPSVNSILTG